MSCQMQSLRNCWAVPDPKFKLSNQPINPTTPTLSPTTLQLIDVLNPFSSDLSSILSCQYSKAKGRSASKNCPFQPISVTTFHPKVKTTSPLRFYHTKKTAHFIKYCFLISIYPTISCFDPNSKLAAYAAFLGPPNSPPKARRRTRRITWGKNEGFNGVKLAQHTTPRAKTHRTATLFASEPTENLKMFINVHHRNITIPHQNITAASPPVTETPKHRRHRAETLPTQNQGITHISPKHHNTITTHHRDTPKTSPTHHLKITKTSLAHAENILTHHQRITETSPRYHRIIHETQTKHNRDLTETSPKHHQDITET